MPIQLFEARQILLKIETTEGTEAAPAGATDALLTFDGSVQVESDKLERNMDSAYFAANPFKLVNRRCKITYYLEALGHATVGSAAPIGPVLRIAAHGETLTPTTSAVYAPATTSIASGTHHFNHGGVLFKALGSRANITHELMIDGYWKIKVEVTGLVAIADLPAAVAAVATTLTAFRDPPVIDASTWSVTLNSVPLECTKFTLNHGVDLQVHHHSEGRRVMAMDRSPSGVITCYLPTLGTLNPWSIAANHTLVPFSCAVDGGASKIATLSGSKLQLEEPRVVDLKKGLGLEIPFVPLPTGGNDEYALAFT